MLYRFFKRIVFLGNTFMLWYCSDEDIAGADIKITMHLARLSIVYLLHPFAYYELFRYYV